MPETISSRSTRKEPETYSVQKKSHLPLAKDYSLFWEKGIMIKSSEKSWENVTGGRKRQLLMHSMTFVGIKLTNPSISPSSL